jgi:hypothetical protein
MNFNPALLILFGLLEWQDQGAVDQRSGAVAIIDQAWV